MTNYPVTYPTHWHQVARGVGPTLFTWTTTVQAPSSVVKATWGTRTLHDSGDGYRRTRIEAPGSEMAWGWERGTGEGRKGGMKVSAAATWQGAGEGGRGRQRKRQDEEGGWQLVPQGTLDKQRGRRHSLRRSKGTVFIASARNEQGLTRPPASPPPSCTFQCGQQPSKVAAVSQIAAPQGWRGLI